MCLWTVWKAWTLLLTAVWLTSFLHKMQACSPLLLPRNSVKHRATWALCSQTQHVKNLEISILWLQHQEEDFSSENYWHLLDMLKQNKTTKTLKFQGKLPQPYIKALPRSAPLGQWLLDHREMRLPPWETVISIEHRPAQEQGIAEHKYVVPGQPCADTGFPSRAFAISKWRHDRCPQPVTWGGGEEFLCAKHVWGRVFFQTFCLIPDKNTVNMEHGFTKTDWEGYSQESRRCRGANRLENCVELGMQASTQDPEPSCTEL